MTSLNGQIIKWVILIRIYIKIGYNKIIKIYCLKWKR